DDEAAGWHDLEAPLVRIGERRADQARGEALAFVLGRHLGVGEDHAVALLAIDRDGKAAVGVHLIAVRRHVVAHRHGLALNPASDRRTRCARSARSSRCRGRCHTTGRPNVTRSSAARAYNPCRTWLPDPGTCDTRTSRCSIHSPRTRPLQRDGSRPSNRPAGLPRGPLRSSPPAGPAFDSLLGAAFALTLQQRWRASRVPGVLSGRPPRTWDRTTGSRP